jgi:hypothetical protein
MESDTVIAKKIIARIKIIRGEIEMQECRIEEYIDQLSAERLKDIEEPTESQIEESRRLE